MIKRSPPRKLKIGDDGKISHGENVHCNFIQPEVRGKLKQPATVLPTDGAAEA